MGGGGWGGVGGRWIDEGQIDEDLFYLVVANLYFVINETVCIDRFFRMYLFCGKQEQWVNFC